MEFQNFEKKGGKGEEKHIDVYTINKQITDYYNFNTHSGVEQFAQGVENQRQELKSCLETDKSQMQKEMKNELSLLRFGVLNDIYGGDQYILDLYKELKNDLDIDLFVLFDGYNKFIEENLIFTQGGNISVEEYKLLLKNIRTIFIMQFHTINEKIIELKEKNGGGLVGLQWILNGMIQENLQDFRGEVLTSAKFMLDMEKPELKQNLVDKIGKTHVQMRQRQIYEALMTKQLVEHHKTSIFDFALEDTTTREIDSIPTDIIGNDSFWTADKVRNGYRDNYIYSQDYGNGSMKEQSKSLGEIHILNEKDKQTELEYLVSGLVFELVLSLPIVGVASSVANIVSSDNMNIELIKSFRPDLDQNYQVVHQWPERVQEGIILILGIIGARAVGKAVDYRQVIEKITGLGASADIIKRAAVKAAGSLGIDINTVLKIFQFEQTVYHESKNYSKAETSFKTNVMKNYFDETSFKNDISKTFSNFSDSQVDAILSAHKMRENMFRDANSFYLTQKEFIIKNVHVDEQTADKIIQLLGKYKIDNNSGNMSLSTFFESQSFAF